MCLALFLLIFFSYFFLIFSCLVLCFFYLFIWLFTFGLFFLGGGAFSFLSHSLFDIEFVFFILFVCLFVCVWDLFGYGDVFMMLLSLCFDFFFFHLPILKSFLVSTILYNRLIYTALSLVLFTYSMYVNKTSKYIRVDFPVRMRNVLIYVLMKSRCWKLYIWWVWCIKQEYKNMNNDENLHSRY